MAIFRLLEIDFLEHFIALFLIFPTLLLLLIFLSGGWMQTILPPEPPPLMNLLHIHYPHYLVEYFHCMENTLLHPPESYQVVIQEHSILLHM